MSKKGKILIVALIVCVLLAIAVTVWLLFFRAPKLESVYDRVVELVEASNELNTVFYGAGLPVYEQDSDYANFTHMYYGFEYGKSFESVKMQSKFMTTDQIKQKAELVYSKAYLEDVLYPLAFTGYVGAEGSSVAVARYLEDENGIVQSVKAENYLKGIRIYDYSTMKITFPSNSKAFYVTMDSWLEDSPEQIVSVRLRFVLQDGQWYLDSFTG
jgi:hypothetical protein